MPNTYNRYVWILSKNAKLFVWKMSKMCIETLLDSPPKCVVNKRTQFQTKEASQW
jgi:hypothetical protein